MFPSVLGEGPDDASACIVHQHIQPAETIDRKIDCGAGNAFRRQITRITDNLGVEFLDQVFCRFVELCFIQICDDQPGAIARQTLRDRKADASRGARHDGNVVSTACPYQTLPSQNDADAPLGAKTFAVEKAALFLDLECAVARHQTISIAAEVSVRHAILGAVGDERRADF